MWALQERCSEFRERKFWTYGLLSSKLESELELELEMVAEVLEDCPIGKP